jgi:hypothetical protein
VFQSLADRVDDIQQLHEHPLVQSIQRSRYALPTIKKDRMNSGQSKIIDAIRNQSPEPSEYARDDVKEAISRTFQTNSRLDGFKRSSVFSQPSQKNISLMSSISRK